MLLEITEDFVVNPDHLVVLYASGFFNLTNGMSSTVSLSSKEFCEAFKKLNNILDNNARCIRDIIHLSKYFSVFYAVNNSLQILVNRKFIAEIGQDDNELAVLKLSSHNKNIVVDISHSQAIMNASDQYDKETQKIEVKIQYNSVYKVFGIPDPTDELKALLNKQNVSYIKLKLTGKEFGGSFTLKYDDSSNVNSTPLYHHWTAPCYLHWMPWRTYTHTLHLGHAKHDFYATVNSLTYDVDGDIQVTYS